MTSTAVGRIETQFWPFRSAQAEVYYYCTCINIQGGFLFIICKELKLARIRGRRARPRWRPTTTRRPHPHVQEPGSPTRTPRTP